MILLTTFNHPHYHFGHLKRISGLEQENPDAIVNLNGDKLIGLEATIVILPEDTPLSFNQYLIYNPKPAIDSIIERIKAKSLRDYKAANLDEVWLLINGGSLISRRALEERLKKEALDTKFNRIFIHDKLLGADLFQIQLKKQKNFFYFKICHTGKRGAKKIVRSRVPIIQNSTKIVTN
jgi:hypothetical protein